MAKTERSARLVVAAVIVVVWAIVYLRAAIDAAFQPPAELSGIMIGVVAWLFGSTALGKRERRDDDDR